MKQKLALGIDIGGTNTAFGLVNRDGEIIFENSIPTKQYDDAEALVSAIFISVEATVKLDSVVGIGIGAPNGNHFTGNIEFAPNLHWKGVVPLAKLFEDKFNIPTQLTNDANAAAIGEMHFGATKGNKDFVTITLGTGLGSGVVVNGNIIYGHNGFAGEYGHVLIEPNGRKCGCGRNGCLEAYVSATGIKQSAKELDSDNKQNSSLLKLTDPSCEIIFEESKKGDLFAQEIIDFTAKKLGQALATFMCFSNPNTFVLFGGCVRNGEDFAQKVKDYMNEAAIQIYQYKTDVIISKLQDKNAAILGTAAAVFQTHKETIQK